MAQRLISTHTLAHLSTLANNDPWMGKDKSVRARAGENLDYSSGEQYQYERD